jgi:hypothetical protein
MKTDQWLIRRVEFLQETKHTTGVNIGVVMNMLYDRRWRWKDKKSRRNLLRGQQVLQVELKCPISS